MLALLFTVTVFSLEYTNDIIIEVARPRMQIVSRPRSQHTRRHHQITFALALWRHSGSQEPLLARFGMRT